MNTIRKALILSLKVGSGHLRAAEATASATRERYENSQSLHLDMLDYTTPFYRRAFTGVYGAMVEHFPIGWKVLYEQTRNRAITGIQKRFSAWVTGRNAGPLMREIQSYSPDVIICTHFTAAEAVALARRRQQLQTPVCVVLTDYDLHAAWLHRGVDCYCVATEQMATDLRRLELFGADVHVTGIPIHPVFAREFPHRHEMRKTLKLPLEAPTVVLTGGGCGLGALSDSARILLRNFPTMQIIAVAGGNAKMQARLEREAQGHSRLIVKGYVSNMHEYMAASDLIVTKPGGLTSSECLAMGLPAVVSKPIPGQEERNSEFLIDNKVALPARNASELVLSVRALVEDEGLRHYMSARARSLAKRRAAYAVAEVAWNLMDNSNPVQRTASKIVVPPASATPVAIERRAVCRF